MPDNKTLVFAPGNQWVKDAEIAPFFGFPSWWRRFVFRILSPRELSVYLYVCSTVDPNAVAYPSIAQISAELGIKSPLIVKAALDRLVELGFLLRSEQPLRGRLMSKRYVFQRPAADFTLLTLLKKDLLDSRLNPIIHNKVVIKPEYLASSGNEAVNAGLRRLIDSDAYELYQVSVHTMNEAQSKDTLVAILEARLQTRVDLALAKARRASSTERWSKVMGDIKMESIPSNLRSIFRQMHENYLANTRTADNGHDSGAPTMPADGNPKRRRTSRSPSSRKSLTANKA